MDYENPKYRYVHCVADKYAPEFMIEEDGEEYQVASNLSFVFLRKMEKIEFPFTYDAYITNKDIVGTLKAYDIDLERFWYAMLFIYDLTQKKCVNAIKTDDSAGVQMQKLSDHLADKESFVIITEGNNKIEINDRYVVHILRNFLNDCLSHPENNLDFHSINIFADANALYSSSVQMWFAASRFFELFESLKLPNKRAKDSKDNNNIISYNKTLLVSRILYMMKFTKNDAFLDSDNSLKGIIKQYKDFNLESFSKEYFV